MKTSVAMCTYNGERFLKKQLDSILSQTVPVGEIIICDDCSTDNTQLILKDYQKEFPDLIKLYINDTNLRSVKNFEKAISLCQNEIIFLSDQDDIWVVNKVEKYLEYLEKHPNISVLCSNGYGINEKDEELDVFPIWEVPHLLKQKGKSISYYNYIAFIGNIATGASMAIRKTFLVNILPFPIIQEFHHDEWIALIASSCNKFEILNEKYFKYRVHDSQQVGGVFYTNSTKKKKKMTEIYSINPENKNFFFYKAILKKLSTAYKKHTILANTANVHTHIFRNNKEKARVLFMKRKKEFRLKYPIHFFILNLMDRFNGKRKL